VATVPPSQPTRAPVLRHDIDVSSLPPGPTAPRAWQTLSYGWRPIPFFARAHARYGDVFTVKVLRETWVVLAHPAAIRQVLMANPREMNSGEANLELRPVIGTRNVLLLDGAEHLRRRKLLLPPFHGDRMQAYRALMADAARAEVRTWPSDEAFPLLPRMQAITFEVILRAVFGDEASGRLGTALRRLQDWLTGPVGPLLYVLLGAEGIVKVPAFRRRMAPVDEEIHALIRARRADPGLAERGDILSLLLQIEGLDDGDVRDELLTLLVAGHETTAAALAWAWAELLRAPAAMERLAAREPGWAEAVTREALRLHPPVPLILRKLLEPLEVAGRRLPAGTTVAPSSILLHRRSDLYPEPLAFRPERWVGETPGTYEWLPFGGSVRRCLGASFAQLEMQVVLEEVAASARLRAATPAREATGRRGIILTPAHGALAVMGA
jgi:cytochrome P450